MDRYLKMKISIIIMLFAPIIIFGQKMMQRSEKTVVEDLKKRDFHRYFCDGNKLKNIGNYLLYLKPIDYKTQIEKGLPITVNHVNARYYLKLELRKAKTTEEFMNLVFNSKWGKEVIKYDGKLLSDEDAQWHIEHCGEFFIYVDDIYQSWLWIIETNKYGLSLIDEHRMLINADEVLSRYPELRKEYNKIMANLKSKKQINKT
jgi:hypothetical protein